MGPANLGSRKGWMMDPKWLQTARGGFVPALIGVRSRWPGRPLDTCGLHMLRRTKAAASVLKSSPWSSGQHSSHLEWKPGQLGTDIRIQKQQDGFLQGDSDKMSEGWSWTTWGVLAWFRCIQPSCSHIRGRKVKQNKPGQTWQCYKQGQPLCLGWMREAWAWKPLFINNRNSSLPK